MLRIVPPETILPAQFSLPVSKSVINRWMVMEFLADKKIRPIVNGSDDTLIMQSLIAQLSDDVGNTIFDAGDAGTVFRFMLALLALKPGKRTLTGSNRMLQRPCTPLVDSLTALGAEIRYIGNTGFPPLEIEGGRLKGGKITIDASISSQFVSALMMIAPLSDGGLEITLSGMPVSLPYIHLTGSLMQQSGIDVEIRLPYIKVLPGKFRNVHFSREADWSAAAFWFALASLKPGNTLVLKGLNPESAQGDKEIMQAFAKLGVHFLWNNDNLALQAGNAVPENLTMDLSGQPDAVPALAIACAGMGCGAEFSGLSTLRIKESDRIAAIIDGLTNLGYRAYAPASDRLCVLHGRDIPKTNVISAFGDHRIAMAFAVLSAKAGDIIIDQPEVVTKSYPAFWEHMKMAGFKLENL